MDNKWRLKEETLLYYIKRFAPSLRDVCIKIKGRTYHVDENGSNIVWAYVCPLCMDSTIAIVGLQVIHNDEFDLDHYPPKSVGGTRTVLTCKPCNSNAGDSYDYTLKQVLESRNFWVRKDPDAEILTKAVYQGAKGWYHSKLKHNDGILVHLWETKKTPNNVQQWMAEATKQLNWKIELSFSEPSEKLVYKALLKAAYLYCFSVFGYEFAFTHIATNIRNILNS